MKNQLVKLADYLDGAELFDAATKVDLLLKKIALSPRLEHLKQELKSDLQPLKKLMEVYREAQRQTKSDLTALFGGNEERALDFEASYPDYVPDDVESKLVREFGQEQVDYYLYGIGTDENFLTTDDVQELLLHLLDTHPKLRRIRDKNQIKERFGIISL